MDAKGRAILERIKRERDFVPKSREVLAEWDSTYLEYYHNMFMHVRNNRKGLSPKMMELLLLAIDAAGLYEQGLEGHMRSAFKAGATPHEVLDALMAASVCSGIHALSVSLPTFADVVKDLGLNKEGKEIKGEH
jgi:alkylhydroperoxidase/carboxymuconolactone decarboxylase family protein YurZ